MRSIPKYCQFDNGDVDTSQCSLEEWSSNQSNSRFVGQFLSYNILPSVFDLRAAKELIMQGEMIVEDTKMEHQLNLLASVPGHEIIRVTYINNYLLSEFSGNHFLGGLFPALALCSILAPR